MIGPSTRVRVLGCRAVAVATIAITVLCLWGVGARLSEAGGQQRASSGPLPETFGFGRPATSDVIARLDIDVMPDGMGLPPGGGTAADGAPIWGRACRGCHGREGEGGIAAPLVGRDPSGRPLTVGNLWPYATTLYDYIRRAMPQLTPGILTSNETYAVVGYILNMNGLVPADAVMDAATLPAVEMPARDRFVLDDREGGPEVR